MTRVTQVEATPQNINDTIFMISQYANDKGYVFNESTMPAFRENSLAFWQGKKLEFDSKTKKKVCHNYLTRLSKNVTMRQANLFLHFMWRQIMKIEGPVPKIQPSEREFKIRQARKAWKTAFTESEKLRNEYKEIKGDFFKMK